MVDWKEIQSLQQQILLLESKSEQELLDEIQRLKKENGTYKEQIKILTELIDSCKRCLQSNIEVLPK